MASAVPSPCDRPNQSETELITLNFSIRKSIRPFEETARRVCALGEA